MQIATMLLQVLIAFLLTAVAMPVILVAVPATRDPVAGPVLSGVLLVVLFGLVWLVWPRRRR